MIGYVKTKNASETSPGVWTQTGFRSLSDIETDLRLWSTEFNIDGIFLDEVSNLWQVTSDTSFGDHIQFYQTVFQLIDSINSSWTITINPGSPFPTAFFNTASPGYETDDLDTPNRTADIALAFESSIDVWDPHTTNQTCLDLLWTDVKGSYSPGPWCRYVPDWDGIDSMVDAFADGTFASLGKSAAVAIYGADNLTTGNEPGSVTSVLDQAVRWNVSYLYLTDRSKVLNCNEKCLYF